MERAALATGAELTTQTAGQTNDAQRAVDKAARKEQKVAEKAAAKTQDFLEPVVQEDRTAAEKSERTGKKIEVGATETVEAAQGTVYRDVGRIDVFGRSSRVRKGR